MFQPPKGTQDFLQEEMVLRNFIFDTLRNVYEKWGYGAIETPVIEDWKVLSAKSGGGEAVKNEIYYFKDKSDREIGLRFDLTVPMARVVASNPDMPKPFKRYHIGRVWRYDNPGSGRRREFWQSDIDIVGSEKIDSDIEVIMVVSEALEKLGFDDFEIGINNRKILKSFLDSIDVKSHSDILISIDKIEKIGEDGVKKELIGKGLDNSQIEKILNFIKSSLDDIEDFEGVEETKNFIKKINSLGNTKCKINLSMVRGLEYYTDLVFEIFIKNADWSVGGGGRYDNLVEALGGKKVPAVGISIGVERIFELMKKNFNSKSITSIFFANATKECKSNVFDFCQKVRQHGINAETDLMDRSLTKQIEYASAKKIPFLVVIGNNEIESGKIKLRDMNSGNEVELEFKPQILAREIMKKHA